MGPMQSPNLSVTPGQDNTTVGMQDAPIGTQPRLVKPSFAEANATGGPLSDKLTSKGKILSFLIDAAQGAAAGDAAARTGDPRHGYAGLGSAAEAGFNVPIQNAQRRNALEQQQLEMQKTQAQTAAIPGHAAAELAEMQARTGNLNAQANRRENYTVPGVGLVSPDASQPNGYRVVVPEPAKGKDLGDADSRHAWLQQRDPNNKIWTPSEQAAFEATGQFPKNAAEKNPTEWSLRMDAQDSDPAVSGPANKALQQAEQDRINFHKSLQKVNDPSAGMTAAQKRTLGSNPDWTSGQEELRGANESLAKNYAFAQLDPKSDPESDPQVQADRKHVAAVLGRMEAAKSRALGGSSNAPASNVTPVASHQTAQSFSHVSSDGKWGWNGTSWVATGK
jgi:hypothetical protein